MAGTPPLPRPPVRVEPAFDDPARVRRLVEARAPYGPVQRYFANDAEYAALSGAQGAAPMVVAPVFRGSWAADGVAAPDVAPLLAHPPFADAARRLFDAEIVCPQALYVNLTWQLPFAQGAGHTDVPAFLGVDRRTTPIAWLAIMGQSGLFEDVRLKIATAVAWLYEGADGGFEYWPDGPGAPSRVHEGRIENTALVGDNDFMWHRVRPTGRAWDGMARLSLGSELAREAGSWCVRDGARELGRFGWDALRVSLSWKALVFAGDAERRRYDEHADDLDVAEVVRRFRADLGERGVELEWPADPVRDPALVRRLTEIYVRYPGSAAAAA
jgi:hypothetical protein